jgi:hypothetical protein
MEVSGQIHAPAALPSQGRSPNTHCIGGWVGPGTGLVSKIKIPSVFRESNPDHPSSQSLQKEIKSAKLGILKRFYLNMQG